MKKINNIFIIDDDRIIVYGIQKMLSTTGLCDNISAFANGRLALNSIEKLYQDRAQLPDVIFLDINMPIMDGWQFLEALIALPFDQKIRINIVTSSIDPLDLQQYERYKKRTEHTLTYNHKPLKINKIKDITMPA
ncbi:MAG: response regulator [Pricia sp.]